jgi:hypothetical protein
MHFDFVTAIGFLGGAFYLASHYQKAMLSLRVLSLASNILFLVSGVLHEHFEIMKLISLPEFLLNAILVPVNAKRLTEIIRLTKQIEKATVESPISEWLLPHMHLKKHSAGEVLFRRGDRAHEILYVAAGRLKRFHECVGPLPAVPEKPLKLYSTTFEPNSRTNVDTESFMVSRTFDAW